MPPIDGGRKCGEKTDGVEETLYPRLTQGLDDDVPLVPMPGTGEVPHVLEQDHGRSSLLEDAGDVPEERSSCLVHPALVARLREGLAGEAGGENVVLWNLYWPVFWRGRRDVRVHHGPALPGEVLHPVPQIGLTGFTVDLRDEHALPTSVRQHRVEPADSGEEIRERE